MKVNEAPEKIYLSAIDLEEVGHLLTESNDRDDVEYIRTGAFIEKAVKWLDKTLRDTDFYENEIELFIKEFKKAMKGE